jgi:hypothetical protein
MHYRQRAVCCPRRILGPHRRHPNPRAPLLQIINTGTNAVAVVWPATPTSFVLQQNTYLDTTNWFSLGCSGATQNISGVDGPKLLS